MLPIRGAIASPLLLLASSVAGQVSAPTCQAAWEWTTNSIGQSPCLVAAYLESVCNDGQFVIPQLTDGQQYQGPTRAESNNLCMCNTVVYCLISACTGCQLNEWSSWPEWRGNCSSVASNGTLSTGIPPGTLVPHWAFQGITPTGMWDNVTASGIGGLPESSAGPGPTGHSSTEHPEGAVIAGSVVGGVVGLLLFGLLCGWLLLRYRRSRIPPSAQFHATGWGYDALPITPSSADPTFPKNLKHYDPTDPSTFPPVVSRYEHQKEYRGLPEV
ncbi:hypothetical protein BV25DRAFT_249943 [Artomyces pyxidatus]|uniref:Uncharacterized protein n=1 Tax=Artomyces pyxidatus TaxID=48021 RepID=A0ACB8T706_9AGAM|nr:hypothetical protein BV25DRAFT_249943 [Artomyces pyxidatus]